MDLSPRSSFPCWCEPKRTIINHHHHHHHHLLLHIRDHEQHTMTATTTSTNSHNQASLPIVSLAQWKTANGDKTQRQQLAKQVRDICHTTGFFLLQDHGISIDFIRSMFHMSRQLFALPLETKRQIDKKHSPHFRGWECEGSEYTNNRPDHREQVDLWTEHPAHNMTEQDPNYLRLLGPNQWFSDPSVLPGYQEQMARWFEETKQVADCLMEILAVGLDLDPHHFDHCVFGDPQRRMSLTKLIRYPPTPVGEAGVNAHHDTGFLTLLACRTTPGLQVETEDGQWMNVTPPTEDTLVVNLGEMLQAMTCNYYVATSHRVIVQKVAERFSIGYFHGPSLDTELSPLVLDETYHEAVRKSSRHAKAGFMASRKETQAGVGDMKSSHRAKTYGEQLWNYFKRSYPDNMARHYPKG
eukprot:scaffold2385_cov178-Amphora_coffeaeformis.AAC.15